MRVFATEFEIDPLSDAAFIASAKAWVEGMQHQTVFSAGAKRNDDPEQPELIGVAGDKLTFRKYQGRDTNRVAIGLRHEFPDAQNCLWRTEAVQLQQEGAPCVF